MEAGVQATPPLLKTGAISKQTVIFLAAVFYKYPAAPTTSQVWDGTEQPAGSWSTCFERPVMAILPLITKDF